MGQGKFGSKLGRTTSHRKAMLRTMVTSLLKYEKIQTTDMKAKELKKVADKMITLGSGGISMPGGRPPPMCVSATWWASCSARCRSAIKTGPAAIPESSSPDIARAIMHPCPSLNSSGMPRRRNPGKRRRRRRNRDSCEGGPSTRPLYFLRFPPLSFHRKRDIFPPKCLWHGPLPGIVMWKEDRLWVNRGSAKS